MSPRDTATRILAAFALAALAACQRDAPAPAPERARVTPPSAPVPARAASVASRGAPDDTPDALMREAFPDWGGQKAFVTTIPSGDPKDPSMMVAVSPEFVVPLDDTHRVLVTRDTISDEAGRLGGGHPLPGAVGGYWFAARAGRWFVARREDAMLLDGASGEVGAVAALDLGAGHRAITITAGDCHEGACTEWVDVVELGPDKSSLALGHLQLASRNEGFEGRCGDILAGGKAASAVDPDECVDIRGQWRIEPNAGAPRPDIVVTFSGHELVRAAAASAVVAKAVDERQVLRYQGGKYVPVSGRNPVHGF